MQIFLERIEYTREREKKLKADWTIQMSVDLCWLITANLSGEYWVLTLTTCSVQIPEG
jgi:hypothetical protein